jgi:hypothetical protein
MTSEERAAYMREYRKRQPKKRPAALDRSRPVMRNVKLDRPAYQRQYMRWYRSNKFMRQRGNSSAQIEDTSGFSGCA